MLSISGLMGAGLVLAIGQYIGVLIVDAYNASIVKQPETLDKTPENNDGPDTEGRYTINF